jgi:small subunit ribosomal protein S6
MENSEQREYELVYILQPDLDETGVLSLGERVGQVVASKNGAVVSTEVWGRRTLAYPIKRYFEGQYILTRLQMDPTGANDVERLLRLNESVLRYLLIRTDD